MGTHVSQKGDERVGRELKKVLKAWRSVANEGGVEGV
jgi:hypothetical protein